MDTDGERLEGKRYRVSVRERSPKRKVRPLGRTVGTFRGRNGHTRVAKVQCGERTLVRPIYKLVPLDS